MSYRTLSNLGVDTKSTVSNHKNDNDEKRINVPVISCIEDKRNLIAANRLCVIEVYADWCEPCNYIKHEYEKLCGKYTIPNICVLAKEDVELRLSPEVHAVPSFLFYKDGKLDSIINGGNLSNVEKKINEFFLTFN